MSPLDGYDGNGTFKEYRLLILDALKRAERRIDRIEKQLWAVLAGLAAFMAKFLFEHFVSGG
jgi:hypothetical protein